MPCTHSRSVFLKAMARGDERRSMHRQDIRAFSSGPSVTSHLSETLIKVISK
jgi:hypothetical protein